jgi:pyruvate dehydrogenase E2 component (dihydrolipoamide acetyltransferase)
VFTIQLARLGQTMEQGTLVRWCKQVGEPIEIGEDLYEVETEKAIVPVQVTRRGTLLRHVTPEGTTVPVGAVLAVAGDPGESPTDAQVQAMALCEAGSEGGSEAAAAAPSSALDTPAASSVASGRALAAPKARALAAELGVELRTVSGTGPDGLITPDDVRRAVKAAAPPAADPAGTSDSRILRKVPLSPITRSMMSALEKGWQVPQFTQITLVDASALVRRKASNADGISYMDFFLDALVSAAQQVPEALVSIHGNEAWYHAEVDVTIALATDSGLLVPVLRNAAAMRIVERGRAWRALGDKGRAGKLVPSDMSGGIIALSNLGSRGVDYGTPLLPPGHALIAFIGALENRALVVNDRIEARPSVYLSVAYDHRIIDGALAARVTSSMRAALETDAQSG